MRSIGLFPSGCEKLAMTPVLVQTSTKRFPQPTSHASVQSHPNTPPTLRPVSRVHDFSKMIPKAFIRKKMVTLQNPVPSGEPIPQSPATCRRDESKNAGTIEPAVRVIPLVLTSSFFELSTPLFGVNGTKLTNNSRKSWCHLRLQNSARQVAFQGLPKSGGHCQGSFPNNPTPVRVMRSYPNWMEYCMVRPERRVMILERRYRWSGGRFGSKIVIPSTLVPSYE